MAQPKTPESNAASLSKTAPLLPAGAGHEMDVFGRVLRYLRPHRGLFIVALVCTVIFGISDGAVPFLISNVLDGVFGKKDEHLIYLLPAIVIAFSFIRAASDFGQQYYMARVGHLIVRDIRNEINSHLLKLTPEFFVRSHSGDIISLSANDTLMVRGIIVDSLAVIIRDSIRIVSLLAAAIYLDPWLALGASVVLPIGVYPVYAFGRRIRNLSRQSQEGVGELASRMHESIAGSKVVRVFGREQYEAQRFQASNYALTRTLEKSEKTRALTAPVNEILASFGTAAVLLYGGLTVLQGLRTQGEFIAFLLAIFLTYDPFKKLSRVHSNVQQGLASADRIFEFLNVKPLVQNAPEAVQAPRSCVIELENVSYRYTGVEESALREVSLHVREGETVALVGASGSGKSTLVDLIPRFIDPASGVVKIGGIDVRAVTTDSLRQKIAVVSQHTFLFHDTVFNNIAYGKPGASLAEVEEAARHAFADEFIRTLPRGYETIVGEGGSSLSGGERQRLAIARAMLKNAPILILDEATAALDNRAEREVQKALDTLAAERTCIVIAHRLSTVVHADKIVVMERGSIIETGKHDELLKRSGAYASLYHLQFRISSEPTVAMQ